MFCLYKRAGITKTNVVTPSFLTVEGTGDLRRAHTLNLNKIWMFSIFPILYVCKMAETVMNLLKVLCKARNKATLDILEPLLIASYYPNCANSWSL